MGLIVGHDEMTGDEQFVRALSEFLALHTEQSSAHLGNLIRIFLKGPQGRPLLDASARDTMVGRLKTEMASYNDVPSFLQNYLLTHLAHGQWPAQATFVASRYLARQSADRFTTWQHRQQSIADLEGEPIRGTELGFRQMLYSQGAGPVFRWRGIPCFKSNYDLAIYSMLIDEVRPATIVELGSGAGGSSVLFADLCQSMGLKTRILSIDKTAAEVSDSRVTFIQSDCVEWLAATVNSRPELMRPCLLIEDFHGDLGGFFGDIDRILEDGDYLVIEDSFPKQQRISEVVRDRPYLIDSQYTDFFGVNCTSAVNSIFVKHTGAGMPEPRNRG